MRKLRPNMSPVVNSKLERIVKRHLVNGFSQAARVGRYVYDFVDYNRQIIVEVHGCWHHACPKCFKGVPLMLPQKRSVINDARKVKAARSRWYKVIIVWEHQIKAEGWK